MAGMKRELADTGDDIHPSRKRRAQYSEADAQLAAIYNDLADDVAGVRLKAATNLLKNLSEKSPTQIQRIDKALERLIKGLCSSRKAARLGFSVALSEVLRLQVFQLAYSGEADGFRLDPVIDKIVALTQASGDASGQEKRDYLLGQRFAFQAILQSNVVQRKGLTDGEWEKFATAISELATQKPWLRTECGAILYEYLSSADGAKMSKERVQTIVHSLQQHNLLKTPEGVALWLLISERFSRNDLPKGVWHDNNPLCSDEKTRLKKVLHGTLTENEEGPTTQSGSRQSQPSFAWKIIFSNLYKGKRSAFESFWDEAVENGLFSASSSTERKALGLQIVSIAIATAPTSWLHHVLRPNTVRCIINQRTESGRYLFEAAKVTLNQIVARAKADQDPKAAVELLSGLFDASGMNIDHLTKTKTVETILQQAEVASIQKIVIFLQKIITAPASSEAKETEARRRSAADMLLSLFRAHQDPAQLFNEESEPMPWLETLLATFVDLGYCENEAAIAPPTQSLLRTRLSSCLGNILQQSVQGSISAVSFVTKRLQASNTLLKKSGSKETRKALKQADKLFDEAGKTAESGEGAVESAAQAYQLLFALSILQAYNEEPEAVELLEDLGASFGAWQQGGDAASMVVEILLSFVSKPSALFRKLAEQVFSTFASELTEDSMQSLLDILMQKEGMTGQQELFANHDDEEEGKAGKGDDDEEMEDYEDVEDESDVEIVNGEVVRGENADSDEEEGDDDEGDEEDSESSSDEDSSEEAEANGDEEEDEETAFDRKLAEALGTSGMEADSDDDGSDMDDDQMMEIEPHLTNIFKQRSKQTNSKQDNKDAKENIINFKNRVLDLLAIYVKRQPGSVLALDMVHPLTMIVRTTTSKPTGEKAFNVLKQYFDACNKAKSLPEPEDDEALFGILEAVQGEMKLGGSKLHANACSRASLFLSKVIVAIDEEHFPRIAEMYAKLQSEWYLDSKSKVQGSTFTEWTSWVLATRKQK